MSTILMQFIFRTCVALAIHTHVPASSCK